MFRAVHEVFSGNIRSECGPSTTAPENGAAPTPVVPATPAAAPPTPGVLPRYYFSPQQVTGEPAPLHTPGARLVSEERLLPTNREDSAAAAAERRRFWTPRPSTHRIAGGAAGSNASSRAFGCSLAPSETTPARGSRQAAQDAPVLALPRSLAVVREPQRVLSINVYNTQHYIDPAILRTIPAELASNVPQEHAGTPLVSTFRESGERQFEPRRLISLRANEDPFTDDVVEQGAVRGLQLREDSAFSAQNTGAAHEQSPVRMPFASSSSAAATRSGNSEGWVTTSNLSRQGAEVVTQPAINQAGRSLADNASSALAVGLGGPVGSGESVGPGRTDCEGRYGHHPPASFPEPFPVFQAQDQLRGSAGSNGQWSSEPLSGGEYSSHYQRYAETQLPGRMHRGREQAHDGNLAPTTSTTWPRNNPFLASGTYDDAASSPYARLAYQHPSPMPIDHRHPFASTPPTLTQQPARPTTRYPRADVERSPGLRESGSASIAGQPEQPWTEPSSTAVERSPELDDGQTDLSTPTRPRAVRLGATAERSLGGELASPETPSGEAFSSPSTAGPWVSNYALRSPLERPSRLDAISEASSTPRRGFVGEGGRNFESSRERLVLSRGLGQWRHGSRYLLPRSSQDDDEVDSWWSYGSNEDRHPTPGPLPRMPAQRGVQVSDDRVSTFSATLHRVGRSQWQPRSDLQLHHRQESSPQRTETIRERPSPRDMRGLRQYLDSRRVSSFGGDTNTVATMVRSSPPIRSPRAGSPAVTVPVEWTDIPLTDPPALRAPPHSQPLSLPALLRQRRISLICLAICHLVPLLLFLYATGRLDWVMNWWTGGEIPGMRDSDKRRAGLLGFASCSVAFLVIIVALVAVLTRH
ncbi:MAG: hypothetical protein LQ340_001191 [Diploschistes diacapsis]|nr:MAG: hypothetical protein LQ340_001191 [Diploschistes diacapsis]